MCVCACVRVLEETSWQELLSGVTLQRKMRSMRVILREEIRLRKKLYSVWVADENQPHVGNATYTHTRTDKMKDTSLPH